MIRNFFSKEERLIKFNQKIFYYIFLCWFPILLFSLRVFRHKIHKDLNVKGLKMDRPIVVVANHVSRWDPFILLSSLKKHFFMNNRDWRFAAHSSQFKPIYQRLFFKTLGVYPIESMGSLKRSLEDTYGLIDKNKNIFFFPEGKIVSSGEKQKAKKGIAHLLENKRVYLLPVYLDYTRKSKKGKGVLPGRTHVVFDRLYKSEEFVENFDCEIRHEKVMECVYSLKEVVDKNINNKVKKKNSKKLKKVNDLTWGGSLEGLDVKNI